MLKKALQYKTKKEAHLQRRVKNLGQKENNKSLALSLSWTHDHWLLGLLPTAVPQPVQAEDGKTGSKPVCGLAVGAVNVEHGALFHGHRAKWGASRVDLKTRKNENKLDRFEEKKISALKVMLTGFGFLRMEHFVARTGPVAFIQ